MSANQFFRDIRSEFGGLIFGQDSFVDELRELFNDRSLAKRNSHFELIIAILIVISCVLYVVLTYELPPLLATILYVTESIIIFLFTLEYLCRLYFARSRSAFVSSWYGITDVLTIIPFWLGMFFPFLYGFEYLRALRLFKWNGYIQRYLSRSQVDMSFAARIMIARAVVTIAVLILISASLIHELEAGHNPEIATFGHALYLAVSTATTVGYGDIAPVTGLGRTVAMLTMLISFGLIPFFIAHSMRMYYQYAAKTDALCSKCGLRFHDFNAHFCKHCGTAIQRKPDDLVPEDA